MQVNGANITFGGLASGIDTRAIIDALLDVRSIPLLRLEQKKQVLQQQNNFFGNLDTKLDALKETLTALKDLGGVASVAPTSSDEDVATATATGGAVAGTYDIHINSLAERETFTSQNGFATRDQTIFSGPATYSFDINVGANTYTVDLAGDVTLEDVRDAINASGAPVTAAIIDTNIGANPYELVLTAESTGTDNAFTLDFSASPAGLDTTLALSQTQAAANASFTVNGLAAESQSNSVSDVIDGLTIELLSDNNGLGADVTIDLSTDATQMKDKVQEFIDAYNEVVDLLDKQNQVDEEGKTTAVLFGDSSLRFVGSQIRDAATAQITGLTGMFTSLASIGVTVGTDGRLSLDDEDFESALETDTDALVAVFSTATNGVADRLDSVITTLTDPADGLLTTRRDGIETRTKNIDNRMEALSRRLDAYEERLVAKFAAFESLMSQFQAQGASLGFGFGFGQ